MSVREELAGLPLPQRIQALLEKSGLTQKELAARVGVARPRVNAWANGRATTRKHAGRLAEVASEAFGEKLPADLFSSDRQRPGEAEAVLAATLQRLTVGLEDLTGLLAEQRQLVAQMSRLVAALEHREAATRADPEQG